MNGPKATITRSKLTGFDIGHSHNHSSRSLHVNRRALSRSCCDIDNKSQHEDPDIPSDTLSQSFQQECDAERTAFVHMRVLLNGREGELKLLRARDTLAEIIFQFNEIVVARMVPYFTAGTFTTMVSALYFRRTTDEQNRKKFDSIFMHIAADFLQQTPSIEFARILSALGVFKSVRNQVVHCFSCAYEEADNALKTILQQEPIVEKRSILTEAFTLVMEKICTSTDESNEMTFSEDFVMPRATTTATASTGGGVFVPGNTRRFSSK